MYNKTCTLDYNLLSMETVEIWKDIEGHDGFYQVSNEGRVRSLDRTVFAPLKQGGIRSMKMPGTDMKDFPNGNGYRYVTISYNGRRKNHYIHRLVASAFIPNPKSLSSVNHKNGNKLDNRLNNLEWLSQGDNIIHAYRIGLQPSGSDKPNSKKVIDRRTKQVFSTIKEAADHYGIKYGLLKDALRRVKTPLIRNLDYKNLEYYKEA